MVTSATVAVQWLVAVLNGTFRVVVRININECPMEALEDSDDADVMFQACQIVLD
jgi:hypothetical protein